MEMLALSLALVVLAAAALAALGWVYGFGIERFSRPLRAAAEEAGERTADRVAEFLDWLRLGR